MSHAVNYAPRHAARKEYGIAMLLLLVAGGLGAHKFYLGRTGLGIAYLLTFGLFGIGMIADLFTLRRQVDAANGIVVGYGGIQQQAQSIVVNVPAQGEQQPQPPLLHQH